ncbi:hypothetical protein ACFL09_02970 [Planctomycetota bacterium]
MFRDGKPHTILARVQTKGDRAQILVLVDGKTAVRWAGRLASLRPDAGVAPAQPQAFLVGSTRTDYVFRKIQLRMLSGRAEHLHRPPGR